MKILNYSYNMDYKLDPPDDEPPNDNSEEYSQNDYEIDNYLYDKESEDRYYDTLPGHGFSGSRR